MAEQVEVPQSNATAQPANEAAPLEAEQIPEVDEGYVDDVSVLTESVRSSVYDFRYENGRRYHAYKEGAYFMPNDEPEQERMDIQATAMTLASGSVLHHSPIKDPTRILDVGTGTGKWAIEAGDKYPSAEIIGTDLSPVQSLWVPPNVKFEVDDAEDTWTWPEGHFDLIRTALLISGSISNRRKYFEQAFRVLKPGGYVEDMELWSQTRSDHIELDDTMPAKRWADLMAEGVGKMGRDMRPDGPALKAMMEDIGYVDVVHMPFKIPIGTWPADKTLKQAGAHQLVAMMHGIQSLSLAIFTRGLGWSQEEVEIFLMEARNDFKQKKKYMYWPGWIVYGKKPEI